MKTCNITALLHYLFLFITCALLSSCSESTLVLYTETINEGWYASAHVGTPTPPFTTDPVGQKLIVHWAVPMKDWTENQKLYLHLQFRDFSENTLVFDLKSPYGYYVYPLIGETFAVTKGFLSFKAEIKTDSCVIASWKHQLWKDNIKF